MAKSLSIVELLSVELLIVTEVRVELLITDELILCNVPVIVPDTFRLPPITAFPVVVVFPFINTKFWNISIISFPPKLILISSVNP